MHARICVSTNIAIIAIDVYISSSYLQLQKLFVALPCRLLRVHRCPVVHADDQFSNNGIFSHFSIWLVLLCTSLCSRTCNNVLLFSSVELFVLSFKRNCYRRTKQLICSIYRLNFNFTTLHAKNHAVIFDAHINNTRMLESYN